MRKLTDDEIYDVIVDHLKEINVQQSDEMKTTVAEIIKVYRELEYKEAQSK